MTDPLPVELPDMRIRTASSLYLVTNRTLTRLSETPLRNIFDAPLHDVIHCAPILRFRVPSTIDVGYDDAPMPIVGQRAQMQLNHPLYEWLIIGIVTHVEVLS